MSPSVDVTPSGPAAEGLGLSKGQVVQEFGYDDDVDLELRDAIEDIIDADLEDEDSQEMVDAVVLWWREGDGDLTDALVDSLTMLSPGGPIWVVTPKTGRDGHVDPAEIEEAAGTSGLRTMGILNLAPEWTGTRLASRPS
ncbi:DUF3052 domain-containing protein [Brachybacterium endophyticum]|uniref:DUF3052 domain-containing protein n=1 Tax=Brachybacterium endophyticum TaxID=2182385 RepID=A0A2U2RIC8_9MICO|nr:DUF3052 domain-containing protein [Brachybacterium endophyticum]PWH05591.1 DUF3052 domain-containing protein [Brachybacterium endophyticum]